MFRSEHEGLPGTGSQIYFLPQRKHTHWKKFLNDKSILGKFCSSKESNLVGWAVGFSSGSDLFSEIKMLGKSKIKIISETKMEIGTTIWIVSIVWNKTVVVEFTHYILYSQQLTNYFTGRYKPSICKEGNLLIRTFISHPTPALIGTSPISLSSHFVLFCQATWVSDFL